MQIAPSLHRVGNDLVAMYLIEDHRGVTVIDTGLPGQWSDLDDELTEMGRSISDIRGVILTHGDGDHLGMAERIRRETGAPIYIHEADAPQARGEVKKKNPSWGRVKIGALLSFLWFAGRRGGLRFNPVSEVEIVRGGETLDLPGDPHIIHTPGHSPGSIAIHSPDVDALFVGDAMTTRHVLTGAMGPQPAPFTLDEDEALASLEAWAGTKAKWVLPGHGHPWDKGVEQAVALVRAQASAG